ncbi:MAG: HlyD family efflux transporter periplasmic adaptor subunit [Bacteroidota bacterium]|nr:HlyD family efflux transporter periplasmic adaptor subunit [Bacteroidota bacterium]
MPAEHNYPEEILGPPPAGIISRGLLILVFCMLIILLCGFLIRIPQVIRGRVEIHREIGWCEIRAENNASIAGICVSNNDTVAEGDTLLIFEDQLAYHDFLVLENIHSKLSAYLRQEDTIALLDIRLPGHSPKTAFEEEIQFLQTRSEELRRLLLAENLDAGRHEFKELLEKSGDVLKRQLNRVALLEEECRIREKNMHRMDSLFSAKVIPETELEREKLKLLASRQVLESACARKTEQEHRIQFLQKDLHELERTHEEEIQFILAEIKRGTASLGEKLALWERKNLILAPAGGVVNFARHLSKGKCLDAGESLLSIIPDSTGCLLGKIALPAKGSGQIMAGQAVRIALDNFPVSEYGYFRGRISSISGKPVQGHYQAEVDLEIPDENNQCPEVERMRFAEGTAEVILEEHSLIGMWLGRFR